MNNNYYTDEQNARVLISLLKEFGIKRVIASPGATNVALVGSMQHDPFFEMYSCVDERSAAYMACGMCEESGEPVVLSCTGATSSRNYMPGLTEAYYRNLPILAITSSMESNRFGHLWAQYTDRTNPPSDVVKRTYLVQIIKDEEDYWDCETKINEALLELTHLGGGPIHINLETKASNDFSVKSLPSVRAIKRINLNDKLPNLLGKKIAVFVGSHSCWSKEEIEAIDLFCERYNSLVLVDHTSNYTGKYGIFSSLPASQEQQKYDLFNLDVLIHIGGISGDYYTIGAIHTKEVWRVNVDGVIRDRFRQLKYVFEMNEQTFFSKYNCLSNNSNTDFYYLNKEIYTSLLNNIPDLPLSNIYVASKLSTRLPKDSTLYISILNTLRSWNFFETENCKVCSNVGGFGIDGMTSSMIGASLVNKDKLILGVAGDLNFFYDLNALGNRHVGNNIRLIVINNGHGQEFRQYCHSASILGDEVDEYIAAARHFGNKSKSLVKNFAISLGYDYIQAVDKDSFLSGLDRFVSKDLNLKPVIFEVFTNNEDESNALRLVRNTDSSYVSSAKHKLLSMGRIIKRKL